MNGDIIRILQSDPGFTGYIPRARGLWVAPFVALLLYILFLLIKYFVSLFDTSASGREGGWYGQAGRKSSSRLPFMSQRGSNVPPPPPPP